MHIKHITENDISMLEKMAIFNVLLVEQRISISFANLHQKTLSIKMQSVVLHSLVHLRSTYNEVKYPQIIRILLTSTQHHKMNKTKGSRTDFLSTRNLHSLYQQKSLYGKQQLKCALWGFKFRHHVPTFNCGWLPQKTGTLQGAILCVPDISLYLKREISNEVAEASRGMLFSSTLDI